MHFADQQELFAPSSCSSVAHAGLHPLRGQEVPRPLRRRVHGRRYDARVALARAFLDGARRRRRSTRCARRCRRASEAARVRARRVPARQAPPARGAARAVRSAALRASRRCRSRTSCRATRPRTACTSCAAAACAAEVARPRGARRRGGRLARAGARRLRRRPSASGSAVPTHEIDELLLLSWWFRHRPAELARTVPASALLEAPAAGALAHRLRRVHDAPAEVTPADDAHAA